MRINRALGLGIGIVVLKLLMGAVFVAFEHTLLQFFSLTQTFMSAAQYGIGG